MGLTRLCGPQRRQRADVVFKPTPLLPRPDHTGHREGRRLTAQNGPSWLGSLTMTTATGP
jgi:hypothetical protein